MQARDIGIRTASAAVLAPLALIALWVGGWGFFVLMGVAATVLAMEWGAISDRRTPRLVGAAVGFGVLGPTLAAYLGDFSLAFVILVFGALATALFVRRLGGSGLDAAYGVLYIGWPLVLMVWLRVSDEGGRWTILLFAITWAADIAAYLAGSLFKGPKLWPQFSPNKTWSGFVGALIAGAAAGGLGVAAFADGGLPVSGLSVGGGVALGLAGALATMAGDLWESAIKRRFGVKDTGHIIPGHGGLLDRVDGLMFAVVVVAVTKLVLILTGQV